MRPTIIAFIKSSEPTGKLRINVNVQIFLLLSSFEKSFICSTWSFDDSIASFKPKYVCDNGAFSLQAFANNTHPHCTFHQIVTILMQIFDNFIFCFLSLPRSFSNRLICPVKLRYFALRSMQHTHTFWRCALYTNYLWSNKSKLIDAQAHSCHFIDVARSAFESHWWKFCDKK